MKKVPVKSCFYFCTMKKIGAKLPKFMERNKNVRMPQLLSVLLLSFIFFIPTHFFAQTKQVLKTVVIDAGHGGKDPGCHGDFEHEKHICLEMALKLGAQIKEKCPEVKVIYTRDKDVFVELVERANIANRAKADLFICIHANAGSTVAYGTESYVLGLHRTEAQQKVAERENSIIALEDDKGAKYKEFDMSPDAIIAKQLQLAVYHKHSIHFAELLQREFKKTGRYDRGVKQAGFLVLYKTTMPSVLIETGFLSNPTEEAFIGKPDGWEKMANAMFKAFEDYKNELEGKGVVSNDSGSTTAPEKDKPTEKPAEKPSNATNTAGTNKPQTETEKPKADSTIAKDSTGLIFRVQIETSDKRVSLNAERFKELEMFEYVQDNKYKYCAGKFVNDLAGAKNYKTELIEKGYNHAFVVAFFNGERISIEKAIKLAEK